MLNSEMFEGFVVFAIVNKGSKSEHFAPVLIGENAEIIYLYREGDNPFMYESIRHYHLTYCQVTGDYDEEKNRITVSEIKQITDPVIRSWTKTNNGGDKEVTAGNEEGDDEE